LVISQEYWHYDHPLYRIGGEMMEKGPTIAGRLPELAQKFPDAFSPDGIDFLTYFFREPDKLPTILAVHRFQVKEHPRSGRALFNLAKTLMRTGDRLQARAYLMMAGRAKEDQVQPAAVDWNLKFVQTLIKPDKLRRSYMRQLAGAYGDRNLEFRDGRLYYFRKSVADAKPLFAMSKDTFVLESLPNFRLKIEFDKNGNPAKAVGLYDDGSRDETARDK
jgi:hypothetical protein